MPRFSGSMTRSMGDYARTLGLRQSDLTVKNTMGACGRWSQELPLSVDEGRSFRAVCMSLADYANANGWQLGRMPSPEESMRYCNTRAGSLTGDVRKTLMTVCLKYR
jgi:psiF repeat